MLGFRKVQKAPIPERHRRIFEECGETTIQLTLASGHTPASEYLKAIYVNAERMKEHAELWLVERADKEANREWRIELLEWGVLLFVVLGVIEDLFLLLHSK